MYAGQNWMDASVAHGIQTKRRNPKKKNRLPYHAKRHTARLPIMGDYPACSHSLVQHEEIVDNYAQQASSGIVNTKTVSYAMPCVSKHSSKTVQHRDATGRKW